MHAEFLSENLRILLEQKLALFEDSHGKTIHAVVASLVSKRANAWEEICDYIILKQSLEKPLTAGELLVIAARGLLLNQQSGGLESFIESEECDYWKHLREFLSLNDIQAFAHFDSLMNITGEEFSQHRDTRLDQLSRYLASNSPNPLETLEASYKQAPYPQPQQVLAYL